MSAQRSQFVLKFLPSFADFAFLMPAAFLFGRMAGAKTLLGDCDTGWHIRTGEWIAANHWVPARDIFSFSKPGDPWFAWEWLSDVVFAWINSHGGLRAVVFFAILLLCATFGLLYRLVLRRANALPAIAVMMLAVPASSIHWLARPHLFSLLFTVLFYGALESIRAGKDWLAGVPYLAIFPAATVLWTNLHGGFFIGILMIIAYSLAELLEFAFTRDEERREGARRRGRAYAASALGCLAASLLNPYTYHLHLHMLQYLRDPWNSQHIAEFLSPNFHHPTALFFEALLVLGAASAARDLARGRLHQPILIGMWAHAALLATRNIPIFAIVTAPAAAATLQEWLDGAAGWNVAGWARRAAARFQQIAARTAESEGVGRWHLVSAVALALIAAVIWSPHPPKKFRAEFDPAYYPAGALSALRRDASARIFTNDEWGDYLIWSLYPSHRVFVDGRSDFYGDDFESQYADVMNVQTGWEKILSRFGVDTILLPPDAPLAGALKESSRWHVVYDDHVALVFRPSDEAWGHPSSVAAIRGGAGRDREITKTEARDLSITRGLESPAPSMIKTRS
ncbi:MAG TPA: hypothetical protein VKX45_01440 [Bryobacteraceae bacterium]|nr:hypothetical protein [Bryobacteraceae bacterium]